MTTWLKRPQEPKQLDPDAPEPVRLTKTEQAVFSLAAEGRSAQEVADALYVSRRTVYFHLQSIYGKLEVHSRLQAVNAARKLGLLD